MKLLKEDFEDYTKISLDSKEYKNLSRLLDNLFRVTTYISTTSSFDYTFTINSNKSSGTDWKFKVVPVLSDDFDSWLAEELSERLGKDVKVIIDKLSDDSAVYGVKILVKE